VTRLESFCGGFLRAFLCLTAFISASPIASQEYFEIVDVPVVNVEVVVTSRSDRPVDDLQLEDFTLLVDGQEQEISFFSAPATPGTATEAAPDSVHLVILFDNNGAETQARNAVISQLRELIGQDIDPYLQIMVGSAGLSGLEIQKEFTRDGDLVDHALSRVADTVARDQYVAEYEDLLLDIQRLSGVRDPTQRQLRMRALTLISQIQAFSDRARQEAEITGGHLWQLVEALAGLPGKKAILWVGGAMSISPGEALFAALREALTRTADVGAHQAAADLPAGISTGGGEAIEALSQAASVHQVAVYSIVAGGARQTASAGGSAGSLSTQDSSATDPSATWAPGIDFRSRLEVETALQVLAVETGGIVHTSGRNLPVAWQRLRGELGSFYSLGFHPAGGSDGRLHRMAVEVAGKELQVRHRKTFQVQGWDRETAARVGASLHLGRSENPLAVGLEVRPAELSEEGGLRVPLIVKVPLSSIALEPVAGSHRGQVSVFMVSSGERFRAAPARKTVLPVVLSNDELLGAMGRTAEHRLDLEVPEGTTQIAVGVRDDLDTRVSTLSVELPIDQTIHVPADPVAGLDREPRSTSVASLRLPMAALVMSGQNGGPIGLIIEATLERAAGDRWRVPVEVQMKLEGDGTPTTLDLFAYALSEDGSTVTKESRVVVAESLEAGGGSSDGTKAIMPLELASGRYMIRVGARERESSDFGVTGMEIEIPGPGVDRARWSSSSPVSDLPAAPLVAEPEGTERVGPKLTREEIVAGYREVLDALAASDGAAARGALRALEMGATGIRSPQALTDLARIEGRVLTDLAKGGWNRLLPIAVLYGEMIDDYRRRRLEPLSEHAILVSTQLAERMARQARSPEEKREAADLLTSLSGYLLYSQRLGKTEELLGLAVKGDPHNAAALMALAATREQRGEYASALEALAALLEVSPESDEGRLRFGVNLARTGRSLEAAESFRAVLKADPEEWVAQVAAQELARALTVLGKPAEAVEVLEPAARRWPEQPSLHIQLAWLLDRGRDSARAGEWVSGLVGDSSRATESARFRYLQWYGEGLVETRESLMGLSASRARGLHQRLAPQQERKESR